MLSVRDAGAQGDGRALETQALQAAIDKVAAVGGGTVVVPAGSYRTGTVVLKSHVTLHLEAGAWLVGSEDIEDYRDDVGMFVDGVGQPRGRSLILAADAENVSVEGRGTIDGSGQAFPKDHPRFAERPFLIRFVNCRNVSLTGVKLQNAAAWGCHFLNSETILVHGVTIHSRTNLNNDGLDIDGCRRVRISDCDIDTGDDAICLKCTTENPCTDVTVTNCVLSSDCGAIKCGTESVGNFTNITISNCAIRDTHGCGLKLLSVDGSRMENVLVSDLVMDRVTGPIFLRLGARLRTYHQGQSPASIGTLRGVTIRNVRARVVEPGDRRSGVCISGIPGHCVEDVSLESIHITYPGGGTVEEAARLDLPEKIDSYPTESMFGVLPAYGFYVRHARDISLKGIRVSAERPDARPALVSEDVEGLEILDWRSAEPGGGPPLMRLRNTRDARIILNEEPASDAVEAEPSTCTDVQVKAS